MRTARAAADTGGANKGLAPSLAGPQLDLSSPSFNTQQYLAVAHAVSVPLVASSRKWLRSNRFCCCCFAVRTRASRRCKAN